MNTLQFDQDTRGERAGHMQPQNSRFVLWGINGKVLSLEVWQQSGPLTVNQWSRVLGLDLGEIVVLRRAGLWASCGK